tara:strand:+ start:4678 stop:4950 length:273 start_codon:yes stop_codon:yes gene_type:complete
MEMSVFDANVLKHYNYSELLVFRNRLIQAKKISTEGKELARVSGELMSAVEFEKQLIVANKNLFTIDIVMTIKESEVFDLTGKYDIIGLN